MLRSNSTNHLDQSQASSNQSKTCWFTAQRCITKSSVCNLISLRSGDRSSSVSGCHRVDVCSSGSLSCVRVNVHHVRLQRSLSKLWLQYVKNPSNYLKYQLSWQVLLNLSKTESVGYTSDIQHYILYSIFLVYNTIFTTYLLNLRLHACIKLIFLIHQKIKTTKIMSYLFEQINPKAQNMLYSQIQPVWK